MKIKIIILCFCVVFFSACIPKKNTYSDLAIHNAHIPISIQMPQSPSAFDNLATLLYQALHQQFLHIGYLLVNKSTDGYTLRTKIKSLEPINKLVSPEIILMHQTIQLEIECTLLDFNQKMVVQKNFVFSTLISRPRNPIMGSDFTDFEYKRLCERSAPKIEHFFRQYLFNAFKE